MTRAEAQSFDRLAETYDRLGELLGDVVGDWLPDVVPEKGRQALDLGCNGEVFQRAHFDRVGRAHGMIWDQRFSTSS
jgi:hypothetical protein